jgi:pilus assembly protein TadC
MSSLHLCILWAISVSGLFWYLSRSATEIRYVTLADGRRQVRKLPLFVRLLLPLAPNVTPLLGGGWLQAAREKIDKTLIAAGLDGAISAKEFLALRVLTPLLFGPLIMVCLHLLFARLPGGLGAKLADRVVWFDLGVLLLAFAYPGAWLQGEKKRRHRQIERALPFVLDLLTLSVEAGMDFMNAIQRIVQRRKMDPLSEELLLTFREVQLGKTRREALKNMGRRSDHPDLKSVVQALVQADELGVSIGSILRIQSDQMRTRRFQRAEKKANEAPVKMLFPLVAFIFPAVFIVLLGPVIVQFLQHGF